MWSNELSTAGFLCACEYDVVIRWYLICLSVRSNVAGVGFGCRWCVVYVLRLRKQEVCGVRYHWVLPGMWHAGDGWE